MDNSMMAALRARRSSGGLLPEKEMSNEMNQKCKDMLSGLVESLSDEQKQKLLSMLVSDSKESPEDKEMKVESKQSPGEKMALKEAMNDESEGEEMMDDAMSDEDEIAESLISSSDKMKSENGSRARNLGERVRMSLASKLKKKGK